MIPGGAHALMLGGDPCEVYQIGNSVRFNAADTPYLSRGVTVAGSQMAWTLSAWLKRSALSAAHCIFGAAGDASNYTEVRIGADNKIDFLTVAAGAVVARLVTDNLLRDVSGHLHLLAVSDTGNATASDRFRLYLNGVRLTAFSVQTNPSLNQAGAINYPYGAGTNHRIGCSALATQFFDGYLSDINFVDGQTLDPSAFGFTCQTTGQWRPKAYTGTYGSNGFHLDFSDGSAASAGALGADRSGNGNNWTPTNISVAAGAGCDWLEDTPTNNYCVFNPLDEFYSADTQAEGGLKWTGNLAYAPFSATMLLPEGATYAEFTCNSVGSNVYLDIGVLLARNGSTVPVRICTYRTDGVKYVNDVVTAYGAGWAAGDVIGIAVDRAGGQVTFFKNGVSQGAIAVALSGDLAFSASGGGTYGPGAQFTANFGQQPESGGAYYADALGYFRYTPPAGFKALCTKNLPKSGTVTVSGTFTGNANADGPFVAMNGTPATLTINGNAVTFGTHADALANGFKLRTSSASYNAAGSNSWEATITSNIRSIFRHQNAKGN